MHMMNYPTLRQKAKNTVNDWCHEHNRHAAPTGCTVSGSEAMEKEMCSSRTSSMIL